MPRKKIEINTSQVEVYAAQGLTQGEICLCLGIDESTFYRRKAELQELQDAIKRGKAKAASEISNTLYQMAKGGDLGAIIWYEKTRRGLSDKVSTELTGKDGAPIVIDSQARARAEQELAEWRKQQQAALSNLLSVTLTPLTSSTPMDGLTSPKVTEP